MYVVRNARLYLTETDGLCHTPLLKEAKRFSTKAKALACVDDDDPFKTGREVYKLTYVLRWYRAGELAKNAPFPYFTADKSGSGCGNAANAQSAKTCTRFATREAAIEAAGTYAYPHGGFFEKSGWKPVAVLKRVKEGTR